MKIFLDMDNTVTESRGPISPEMYEMLSKFETVLICSGASKEQMINQIGDLKCLHMAQNGNHTDFWHRELTEDERNEIQAHMALYAPTMEEDQFEDRGCQISYSFTGHHAPRDIKLAFDPTGEKRRAILKQYPLRSDLIEVKIGGTTCLDYYPLGLNKGYNVRKMIQYMKWDKNDCIYIGDALFPGGNDETVVGVIKTKQVKNHLETLEFLKTL